MRPFVRRRTDGSDFVIADLRVDRDGDEWIASAELDGERLWFATRDVELDSAPEAFASAALLPAAAGGRALRVAAPLDPAWRANAGRALALFREWWRCDAAAPAPDPQRAEGSGAPRRPVPVTAAGGTALFFSGGVDSFHALLRGPEHVDVLVMAQGFDFDLDDTARAAAAEASLRAVAGQMGARAVFVRTNAKTHARLRTVSWDFTHGSAMAAVAHVIHGIAGRALFAQSLPGDRNVPCGTHPRLDPLWSSSRMTIASGPPGTRLERMRAIAAEPLLRDHLRVCNTRRTPLGNCGSCAKCILAMLMLEESGQLRHSRVFGDTRDLIARVDALRRTPDRYHTLEEMLGAGDLAPDLARSVRRLVRRSRIDMSWPVQLRRRVAGRVLGWFGIVRKP